MKRDMDLIRKILIAIEDQEGFTGENPNIAGYTPDQIASHAYLMLEADLVGGSDTSTMDSANREAIATRLTWTGHEFLDMARKDTLWEKAKTKALSVTGGLTISALKMALTEIIKQQMASG